MVKKTLVIATKNPGKFREIVSFLQDVPFEFKNLNDYPEIGPITETGQTFAENAHLKARTVWKVTGGNVLADDSGLVCDDLGGRPGVESARYAGPTATDEQNNRQLIEELSAVHDPSRTARYVCALVVIDPNGMETVVEETCEGVITLAPAGEGGFGYDPYFYIPEKRATMAELPLAVKNSISHRGKALKKIHDRLKK